MNTQSKVSLPKYMVKCKHGDECRWMKKGKCPFRHGNLPPKEVWCLNSSHCSNSDCQFKHKRDVWCRFDGYCSNQSCLFKHRCSEMCKYGANCKRYGCLFSHMNVTFPNTFQPVSNTFQPASNTFQPVSNTFQPISNAFQPIFPVGFQPHTFVNPQFVQPQQVVPEMDNVSITTDTLSQV